jgi:phosphatidylserine/phosphatidylglycerophosphate/cardiolipin synthase-like enzyme
MPLLPSVRIDPYIRRCATFFTAVAVLTILVGCGGCAPIAAADTEVYFSPNGGCTQAVVHAIDAARVSIRMQAFSFTSLPIAKALVAAKNRAPAVDVQVVLDKSQQTERYSVADFLLHAGIPVKIDAVHAIAHNKVIIIDDAVVVTGSFNFTSSAEERNAENLIILHRPDLALVYAANWTEHAGHSQPYLGK